MTSSGQVRSFIVVSTLFMLVACGKPRGQLATLEEAQALRQPWTMHLDEVRDALSVRGPSDGASHLIEVTILAPEELAGQKRCLPYDEWAVGAPPPRAGQTLTIAPSTWVTNAAGSHGVPLGGFDGKPLGH
jgi:hypothetical protein